jgi:diguanylate cyclase (GGDEF)-like protein
MMKILIAEDDLVYRRLLEGTLARWGYAVVAAGDGLEARAVLQADEAPRLAILDWMMPGVDGIDVCREVRRQTDKPYIYVLLLTAKDRKPDLIQGLEAGADDYLVKPFDASELKARLSAGRRIIDLQDQLIAAREALRVQATHDPLTGVWNRAAILEILARELARARRQGAPLGVIMADLDHFKRVNDTRGHLAGDAVLREAAQRLSGALRPYDAIGRYGGEEFLIVLPGCDEARTFALAERLREGLGARPVAFAGEPIPVTISLGTTAYDAASMAEAAALLGTADAALYRAKDAGRNRVERAAANAPGPGAGGPLPLTIAAEDLS